MRIIHPVYPLRRTIIRGYWMSQEINAKKRAYRQEYQKIIDAANLAASTDPAVLADWNL